MKEICCQVFQKTVDDNLIRHRSILDVMSKLQEANARVNRAVIKAATSCGCIKITARKQRVPDHVDSYESLKEHMSSHLDGELCATCRDVIESEMGKAMFYQSALLNALQMDLHDIIAKEQGRLDTLGIYRIT